MKVHYDHKTDAIYLRLGDSPIVEYEEVRPGIVLDFDKNDRVVAVEILHVRKQFPESDPGDIRLEVA